MLDHHERASALHLASFYGRHNLIEGLVRHGQRLNLRDAMLRTALHLAGNAEVARVLLRAGASVNAVDARGNTPLHFARNGEIAIVLIEAGADVDALNFVGLAPDQGARVDVAEVIAAIREERAVEQVATVAPIRFRVLED